jgi:hydrogenase maturation protein HypF
MMMTLQGVRIHVSGIVQGVGFRPFVYGLASRMKLAGWVRNTSAGVDIELDGPRAALESFAQALSSEAPALAHIDDLLVTWQPANGFKTFEIIHSEDEPAAFQPISPDVSLCADCLRELFDPHDRRYRYPFINCTNCGPRFTIIQDIPYDRPNTSMSGFPLCEQCAAEYQDPLDRRFHAQPVACPVCGPQIWIEQGTSGVPADKGDAALRQARQLLLEGKILAIKGLGGFHLACDATNRGAVEELRRRKLRVDKPFALMAADIETVEAHCLLSTAERTLMESRQRPILIVRRRSDSPIASEVAPGQNTIGMLLPYTPLHYLLFANPGQQPAVFDMPPLVMTSGNLSEEPICTDNEEARQRLATLADAFLMHNRPIYIRCDDSVARMFPTTRRELTKGEKPVFYPIRRARGYAPDPVRLLFEAPPLFAAGAELKNTFCLTRGRYAFLSHHIGDMENNETLLSFEQGVAHFERLFRIHPEAIAYDLHPNYLATRYAVERAERECLPAIGVQHHHAHIAACMVENGLSGEKPVIGVAFDGTGYGDDEAIWGGEFLIADFASYQRAAHLAYARLPGGDKAVREPWRMALAWLQAAGLPWEEDLPPVRYAANLVDQPIPPLKVLERQLESGLNAPLTSSMGRLFDGAAALMGLRQTVNYEAQAAIEMEAMVNMREPGYYPMALDGELIDPAPMLQEIIADLRNGVQLPVLAARFHSGIAQMVLDTCLRLRKQFITDEVALSGGVWQNTFLLTLTVGLLQENAFKVYLHRQAPTNDGGLSLGQAMVAIARLKNGSA